MAIVHRLIYSNRQNTSERVVSRSNLLRKMNRNDLFLASNREIPMINQTSGVQSEIRISRITNRLTMQQICN